MGERKLRAELIQPLKNLGLITKRQLCVEELIAHQDVRMQV